jgi:hypothetical protein
MRLLCLYYKIIIEPTHSYHPSEAQKALVRILLQSRCTVVNTVHCTLATYPITINIKTGQVINKI